MIQCCVEFFFSSSESKWEKMHLRAPGSGVVSTLLCNKKFWLHQIKGEALASAAVVVCGGGGGGYIKTRLAQSDTIQHIHTHNTVHYSLTGFTH